MSGQARGGGPETARPRTEAAARRDRRERPRLPKIACATAWWLVLWTVAAVAAEPLGPPGLPAKRFPPPDRPVAEIVSPTWGDPADRDKADETGQIARALGIGPGTHVADIGAGSGYHTLRLARIVGPDGRIYAQDVLPRYLATLSDVVARVAPGNVTIGRGDPHDPRLPPGSIDVALLIRMYHEIAQPFAFLHNLVPALRPGARVGIVEYDGLPENHGMVPAQLRCELEASGFRQVELRPFAGITGYVAVFAPPTPEGRPAPEAPRPCGIAR